MVCLTQKNDKNRFSFFSFEASWSTVSRGELMFSSAARVNNAHWHMKTSDPAGHISAVRSRQKTTSRTWGPIGGERLKEDSCSTNFLTTKRWEGRPCFSQGCVDGGGAALHCLVSLHVALCCCVKSDHPWHSVPSADGTHLCITIARS